VRDHDVEPEQDQKIERVDERLDQRSAVAGPTFVARLQKSAGNRAVAALLAGRSGRGTSPVQRDTANGPVDAAQDGGTQPTDGGSAAQALCADPIMTVDTGGIGQTVDGTATDQGQVADRAQPVQTVAVQRDGATPGPGGGNTASVPTVSWADFADAGEDQEFAAQSAWIFGFSAGFTVSKDTSNMWAKPSAKTDATNGPALLRHEQYHFNLAGAMASKATQAQGKRPTSQADFNQLMASTNRTSKQYDSDTNHGLKADVQSTWESNIDGGSLQYP